MYILQLKRLLKLNNDALNFIEFFDFSFTFQNKLSETGDFLKDH